MKPVRVALIGVSGYGKTHFGHLRNLAERGVCTLAVAADSCQVIEIGRNRTESLPFARGVV